MSSSNNMTNALPLLKCSLGIYLFLIYIYAFSWISRISSWYAIFHIGYTQLHIYDRHKTPSTVNCSRPVCAQIHFPSSYWAQSVATASIPSKQSPFHCKYEWKVLNHLCHSSSCIEESQACCEAFGRLAASNNWEDLMCRMCRLILHIDFPSPKLRIMLY